MPSARDVLTPDALAMLQTVVSAGSFAGAARAMDMVPSALSYRVRQIEDALDVLLFDRSARQARLTEAGAELLREAPRLLSDLDAVANRVKRVATGWEALFTIAIDSVIARDPMLDLVGAFYALEPPTRLKLRDETLLGTIEALARGEADLAVGSVLAAASLGFTAPGIRTRPLGELRFVYAVAPHH
ncbi:MAG: LysR family transcriptional regulator, partial [Variovorax sp.]